MAAIWTLMFEGFAVVDKIIPKLVLTLRFIRAA